MGRSILYALLVTVGLSACSSGKTAYRRGDYAGAVQKASVRLAQKKGWGNRGHELAALVLQRAFVKGYNEHQGTIRRLSANPARPFRWEAVFAEYKILQTMTDEVRRTLTLPDAPSDASWLASYPTDYDNHLAETRTLAAAEHYALAEAAYAHRETDRYAAREAYEQYSQALNWNPNYLNASQKLHEVSPWATIRVLVVV